ncbi:MAG: aldo/keto reductase [Hyphomicrobiales bacterium]|nr:aldo/keto reductase [Hyphomicrobiales bacterium]
MTGNRPRLTRRGFLASAAGLALAPMLGHAAERAAATGMITRAIPATGERIPAVGMGTWITFNVGWSTALRQQRREILRVFFERGGGMIDSSPMYGSSQDVVGWCLERLADTEGLISATKVWTPSTDDGREQMEEARALWGVDRFDVMQVHNLVNWEGHLRTLLQAKEEGRIRYIGVTTSHGSRHREIERIMRDRPIDFVQFTYNILDRWAENRLLPLAAERGLGVIVNRPFRRKELFRLFQDKPLPDWIGEFDCENWAQFFLKFIISHPAVTCAIPATTRIEHMQENMSALHGRLPDPDLRRRMVRYVEGL